MIDKSTHIIRFSFVGSLCAEKYRICLILPGIQVNNRALSALLLERTEEVQVVRV
jgi:hypothetical protein